MLEFVAVVGLATLLLGAVVFLRNPALLIPCVVLGLPIEYLGTEAIDSLGQGGIMGAVRALLNPGKAAMLAAIIVALVRWRHEPNRLFPDSTVLLPAAAFTFVVFAGLLWSDSLRPPNVVLILPMYVAFIFVAPTLIEGRRDIERILACFLIAAIVLSLIAIAQRATGIYQWREILVQSDGYSYRSNATFADPNHLARYLVVTMTLATGLILVRGPSRMTLYLAVPTFILGAAAIVATASRSGWIMLMLCMLLTVLFIPIARGVRWRLIGGGLGLMALMVGLLMFQGGADAERLRTLTDSAEVLGLREFLIKAGWAMFMDNPLVGVGSGNYQHALIVSYFHHLPYWATTTLSHTAGVSILAEMGIVGAAMFALVAVRVGVALRTGFSWARDRDDRFVLVWLSIALVGIFLQSQSEGRLLDEPYVWLLVGIVIAYETRFGLPAWQPAPIREPAQIAAAPERTTVPAATALRQSGEPGA